jgi:hypothetical protein
MIIKRNGLMPQKKQISFSDYMTYVKEMLKRQTNLELLYTLKQMLDERGKHLKSIDMSYHLNSKLDLKSDIIVCLLSSYQLAQLEHVNFSNLDLGTNFSGHSSSSFELCRFFEKNGEHLVELSLRNCRISEWLLKRIVGSVPNLKMLDVSENIQLVGDFLCEIGNERKITRLYMEDCFNLAKDYLNLFVMRYRKLTHLELTCSSKYPSHDTLEHIFQTIGEQLCVFSYDFKLENSQTMSHLPSLINLQQLDLTNSQFDEDSNKRLAQLLNVGKSLKSLILTGCEKANDDTFTTMQINAPLVELFLSGAVTDRTFQALVTQQTINTLSRLSLFELKISAYTIVDLIERFKKLSVIEIRFIMLEDHLVLIDNLPENKPMTLHGFDPTLFSERFWCDQVNYSFNQVNYELLTISFERMKRMTFDDDS